jgi:hypothetical protein
MFELIHQLRTRAILWDEEPAHGAAAVPMRFSVSESALQSARTAKAIALYSRVLLMVGFGGLLILMGFAGFDSIQTLRQIQSSNDEIREDFLSRTRVLEQIRSDLYLSGTYVRDYLLEPEIVKAESHRLSLLHTRNEMDSALEKYKALLTTEEASPFQILTQELKAYWKVL